MNKKIDFKDVTFVFPIRLDSIDRLENLLEVISFINNNFETYIHVLEASNYNNNLLSRLFPKGILYTFVKDYDPVFHRTHYINQLVKKTDTDIVAVWDSDVLVCKEQLLKAIELIRKHEADFALPYKNKFLDTSEFVRELYFQTKDMNDLMENESKMKELYAPDSVGGGFLANRKAYLNSGLENEFFYGWGREDGERVNRWHTLGYKLVQVDGCMYHLTHNRGINSRFHSAKQGEIKQAELERLAMMSKLEMIEEIKRWN